MTTAVAVYSSDGSEGRCDAKCHDASEPDCDCVCGGRLHGAGARAIELNTVDYFETLEAAQQWATQHGVDRAQVKQAGGGRRRLIEPELRRLRAQRRRQGIVPGQIRLPLS